MKYPVRKPNRLIDFDYNQNGAYFVTVCTQGRRCLLCDMVGESGGSSPPQNKIVYIVRSIKTLSSKEIGKSIFQRSYYDHVIRNQHDYDEIWQYIENNPRKWVIQNQE